MTISDTLTPAQTPAPPLPEEPARLRSETRTLAEQHPDEAIARITDGEWIAGRLWKAWGPELRERGLRRRDFLGIVRGYRRELWLWVMGERTWEQCADGLRGRALRRAPRSSVAPRGRGGGRGASAGGAGGAGDGGGRDEF
jgi:hypothetical protein